MTFFLSDDQLLDVADAMAREIRAGLSGQAATISAIASYIPLWPRPAAGSVLALDVGGTNARAAVVHLDEKQRLTVEQGPVKKKLPFTRGKPTEPAAFLDCLTRLIRSLDPPGHLPLGYCFSYPARPTPAGDAVILQWTKELFVRNTVGHQAGRLLQEHMHQTAPGLLNGPLIVLNDAVAALLAGRAVSGAESCLGLIAGTGTNLAIMMPPAHIPQLQPDMSRHPLPEAAPLPVNLEAGNFHPPHLTRWDEALDAASHNPGAQRFEKAVSGFYLPYLFQQACPDSQIDPADGAAALFALASPVQTTAQAPRLRLPADESQVAGQLIHRSASLIAASLAGAIMEVQNAIRPASIFITAEGGLVQNHHWYLQAIQITFIRLLDRLLPDHPPVSLQTVPQANLTGCALAGLTQQQQTMDNPSPT